MTRDTENLFEMGGITDGLQCPVKEGFTVLSRCILPPSFFPCHFMFEPAKDRVLPCKTCLDNAVTLFDFLF